MTRSCEAFSGQSAGAVAFGTEAPFLDQLGMQTIVMGPGFIDQAHQPDEYLPLEQIPPGIDLLSRLIHRYCLSPHQ
jgi:acetylornithine deacetylase